MLAEMSEPAPATTSRRGAFLCASLATTGAVLLGLLVIAHLPYDEESGFAPLFLAMAAVFLGGMLAAVFAAFSLARRERGSWLAAAWIVLNLICAGSAVPLVNSLSRLYYRLFV